VATHGTDGRGHGAPVLMMSSMMNGTLSRMSPTLVSGERRPRSGSDVSCRSWPQASRGFRRSGRPASPRPDPARAPASGVGPIDCCA
jgi:hypothetical protein